MLSKNELKYYSSLLRKKIRDDENKFIVEGKKIVSDGLNSNYHCEIIITTTDFYNKEENLFKEFNSITRIEIIKNSELAKLSDTVNPQGIVAVFKIPDLKTFSPNVHIIVCLDNVSDPGNTGTILRNCDWFGIQNVLLTRNCADIYNPKVIRASMGSLFHLEIQKNAGFDKLKKLKEEGYKIISTGLKGNDIFSFKFPDKFILIFSNEANGSSPDITNMSDETITIPKFGNAESLNVASASAIVLSQIKKNIN